MARIDFVACKEPRGFVCLLRNGSCRPTCTSLSHLPSGNTVTVRVCTARRPARSQPLSHRPGAVPCIAVEQPPRPGLGRRLTSSALTKLPNGCPFRWGTVGGWGNGVCLKLGIFGRCGAFVGDICFVEERWGTVGQCPNGAERVTLTRSRARTELPGHGCAICDDRLADYKVCARIVGGDPTFRRIRLISFRDFLSGPTSPSSVDRTRRRWKPPCGSVCVIAAQFAELRDTLRALV